MQTESTWAESNKAELLRFRLCVPALELGSIDARLGRPVQELLTPLLEGEPTVRLREGLREQVWPCCVKPGQGIDLDLRMLGRCSISNDGGQLRLATPYPQGLGLKALLAPHLGNRLQSAMTLAGWHFWIRLPVKGQVTVPVGKGFWVRVER